MKSAASAVIPIRKTVSDVIESVTASKKAVVLVDVIDTKLVMPIVPKQSVISSITAPIKAKSEGIVGPMVNLVRITEPFYIRNPVPKTAVFPERDRMLVFLAKRPLESWEVLTHIGVEHVGVMLMRVSPQLIDLAQSIGRFKLPRLTLDFLPMMGDTSKFGGRVPARIQRNNLRPVDWAVVGFSSWSLDEVREFNAAFDKTYHLGHNDCRDYASRLVSHMTGVKVAPGMISWYINTAPQRNPGYPDIVQLVARTTKQAQSQGRLVQRARSCPVSL